MRNTLTRAAATLAGAAITAAITAALAGPALAAPAPAPQCNATVVDTTAGHVLNVPAVTQSAAGLLAKGADVRIRIMDTAPSGSLDAYEQAQLAACPSWTLNGGIKPNLIVIAVSLDHQDAIFYGQNDARLQAQVDQIRADMGADFRAGNFAAGIGHGEQEIYSALWPSGIPDWLIIAGVIAIAVAVSAAVAAAGGGQRRRGYGGYGYINTGNSYGGGSGGGGTAGGSSGSW